jgi:hypothetical protein
MPRWRLPVWLLLATLLPGCASRTEKGGGDSDLPLPSVRMAFLKIPLNHGKPDVVGDGSDPIDHFVPEPKAVAYTPKW